jgi:iron complex outermembrane receptor protein
MCATPVFAQDSAQAGATNQGPGQSAPADQAAGASNTDQATSSSSSEQAPDIVVTGTIFRNAAAATASPVISLSSTDLASKGINTVSDALQMVSANNGGTLPSSWSSSGFAKGASAPSLRGLTNGRTLTLFDSLRSAVYPLGDDGDRNFVDLNIIPESIVDRIDVLQDGASSTYGADAVAGVVNVIIKKEITGLHLNGSGGISQRGDAGEQRIDGTFGYGKLSEQGWNIYVNGEYQNNNPLYLNARGKPYGTADHSDMCAASLAAPGTTTCRGNGVLNGVQFDGTFNGQQSTPVAFVAPYLADGSAPVAGARYQMLNPSLGCGSFTPYALNTAQQAADAARAAKNGSVLASPTVCQDDLRNRYTQFTSRLERVGANAHLTVNVGPRAQAYAMFNFYQSRTYNPFRDGPSDFANSTAPGGVVETLSPILLPVYVCARGTAGVCTAANGKLNPNNPFAAIGEQANLLGRYDRTMEDDTVANSFRYTAGIAGAFGDGWNYSFDATHSDVYLKYTSKNYINARHLLDVIADGSYNFVNPEANSQAVRDYLSPTVVVNSESRLTQVQGTLAHSFFTLPGGDLQVAVGAAYRKESITNPSGNPPNELDPYDRFYRLNAVSVIGRRNVKSAFFEIDAPVIKAIDLKVSGRYDKYSTGQDNFSPKFEAQFKPIEQFKLRGTFSKGFRIASFNEAFGAPTTGFTTTSIDQSTAAGKAFVAAHGGDAYATQTYLYGLTSIGNPAVKPEKSTSLTLGVVLTPVHWLTLTADYYNIKVKDLITTPDCTGSVAEYYANNGKTTDPACVTAPGVPDPNAPSALPLLGTITSFYTNAAALKTHGFDFTANARVPLGSGIHWTSNLSATLLSYLAQVNNDGSIQRYDGTLGPCEVTSCSGSPKLRGNWTNTLDFNGQGTLSATVNYTSGYTLEAADDGGTPGDCLGSLTHDIVTYSDGVTPVSCHTKRFVDVDLTASIKVMGRFTLYTNILNVLDAKAPFDPSAIYQFNQFNPAWASAGFIGRYIRVGAKVDF